MSKGIKGFQKGHILWNTGLTKETDKRVKKGSEANKGKHSNLKTEEHKQKISKAMKGRHPKNESGEGGEDKFFLFTSSQDYG